MCVCDGYNQKQQKQTYGPDTSDICIHESEGAETGVGLIVSFQEILVRSKKVMFL